MPYDPLEVFANVPSGTVGSPGGTTAPAQGTVEAWTVTVAAAFAVTSTGTRQFHAADQNLPGEIFTVTVCPGGTGSQSWPQVIRGAEGTTPVAHSAGFTVTQVVTAGDLAALQFDPWQFPVEANGAIGDGKIVNDGSMTSGSHTLTCATTTPFLPGDVGKSILVSCAGGGTYSPLATTISAYTSSSVVTLTAAATSSTPGASIVGYGSDNTAAIQATVNAAISYAQANNGYAEVVFSNCIYAVAAAPVIGSAFSYTATSATPCVFTAAGSSYTNGTQVALAGSSVPAGFTIGGVYYVVSASGTTFSLSLTPGGAAIASTSTGSGTVGTSFGNAQITLPVISPLAQKLILVFCGQTKTLDQALMHWNQIVPEAASSVLMCLSTAGTSNGTYGPSSMIGGPFDGYGGDLGPFTNLMPVVDGVQMIMPFNSTISGWDFYGCAEAVVQNGSANVLGVVSYLGGPPYPNIYLNSSSISNQWTFGLRMPCTGNNDRCDVNSWSCQGLCYGIMPSEHCVVLMTRNIYCLIGIETYSGGGVAMPHALRIYYASCEGCSSSISAFDGTINADVDTIDTESGYIVSDTSSRVRGYLGARFTGSTPGYNSSTQPWQTTQPAGIKLVCLDNASLYGVQTSGAPAAPATTVAQGNWYYRDAVVYVTSTTAITAAKVSSASAPSTLTTITGLATAGAGTVAIPVPSGLSWSVTTSGTITTQWVLS